MANPTNNAVLGRLVARNGDDFIQLISSTGTVLGWIDVSSTLQGALASGGGGLQKSVTTISSAQRSAGRG